MTSWFESTNLIEFAYERPEQRNFTSNIIRICSYDCSLFAVPPVIKEKEQVTNVSVLVNQLTNLFCEVEGTPSPIITWYKDDVQVSGDIQIFLISCLWKTSFRWDFLLNNTMKTLLEFLMMHPNWDWKWHRAFWPFKVTESSTIQIVNNGKILKLFKATPKDAGSYSCRAINVAGSSQKYFNIDVLGKENIFLKTLQIDAFLTYDRADWKSKEKNKLIGQISVCHSIVIFIINICWTEPYCMEI